MKVTKSKKSSSASSQRAKSTNVNSRVVSKINEGFHLAYQSETREVERMSEVFFSYSKK